MPLDSVIVKLNNVQTQLLTCGDPFNCDGQDVIICITGNPGIIEFYTEFAVELHKATGLPLCIIGHAGHGVLPDVPSNPLSGQEHLFNLDGQLQHKLELIHHLIDKKSKLHLIGHSIGAWLILELLQDNENLSMRISSVNLLFPTLQRLAETRNGRFLNHFVKTFHKFVLFLFFLAYLVPVSILTFLVTHYLKLYSLPLNYTESILMFLNPTVGEKVLFLAYDEMHTVTRLNIEVIEKIKHLMYVIYSDRDSWVPVSYMDELHELQPQIRMKKVDIDHAFVLNASRRVAEMVAEFINTKTSLFHNS